MTFSLSLRRVLQKLGVLFIMASFFLVALPAHGALVPCGVDDAGLPNCTVGHLIQLVINIYNYLLGLSALVALLMIILGGTQMIIGMQTGGKKKTGAGAGMLKNAVIGLIVVACAYLIVNTLVVVLGGGGLPQLFNQFGIGGVF